MQFGKTKMKVSWHEQKFIHKHTKTGAKEQENDKKYLKRYKNVIAWK